MGFRAQVHLPQILEVVTPEPSIGFNNLAVRTFVSPFSWGFRVYKRARMLLANRPSARRLPKHHALQSSRVYRVSSLGFSAIGF